jgi:hypothetical protein
MPTLQISVVGVNVYTNHSHNEYDLEIESNTTAFAVVNDTCCEV